MTTTRIVHFPDIGYTVRAVAKPDEDGNAYFVEFEAFENEGPSPDDRDDKPSCEGSVKWGGCSSFRFVEPGYMHGCDRDDLVAIGTLLGRVHDLCGEMMPMTRDAGFEPQDLPNDAIEETTP